MREVILPFLGYCLLQIVIAVAGLNIVRDEELGFDDLLKSWIFGQLLLFALLQLLAVPMILARLRFDALFGAWIAAAAALFSLGALRLRRTRFKRPNPGSLTPLAVLLIIAAVALIGIQFYHYLFLAHGDADDARWLAEANDALEYGEMLLRSVHTGEYLGRFEFFKDVSSPWAMMFAVMSRILHTRVTVFTHTIYAPIALLTMYGVYWLIGKELFDGMEARLTFLVSVAVINLFFAATSFTQSVFSLVRIWQGKATVAAVVMPAYLWLFIGIHRRDRTADWLMLTVVSTAASLMSGMGISMSVAIMGLYGAYDIAVYRRWRRIPFLMLALAFPVAFALIYACLKG